MHNYTNTIVKEITYNYGWTSLGCNRSQYVAISYRHVVATELASRT